MVVDCESPDVGRFLNAGDGVGAGGGRGEGGRWPGVPQVESQWRWMGAGLTVAEVVEGGRGLGLTHPADVGCDDAWGLSAGIGES